MELRAIRLLLITGLAVNAGVHATLASSVPVGFRKIRVTDTPTDRERDARINDHGDIVYGCRLKNQTALQEIFLWSRNQTTRLTSNSVPEGLPHINNHGDVVWMRFDGPVGPYGPTSEIVQLIDGVETYLTNDAFDDFAPRISEDRIVVWQKSTFDGCQGSNYKVLLLDTNETIELTDGDHSDQVPCRNESGQIVWTRYDFCQEYWVSEILLFTDGEITKISTDPIMGGPAISETGVVAWSNNHALEIWDNGVITRISDSGEGPRINSRGDISFIRWNESSSAWEAWFYIGGDFRLIAADQYWNIVDDMNEHGDVVVRTGTTLVEFDVWLYQRLPDGDMNCDERVDFDDIDGFVSAITNRSQYETDHPDCDWWLADMTGNRSVDFDDIDGFVICLVNGGCERQ